MKNSPLKAPFLLLFIFALMDCRPAAQRTLLEHHLELASESKAYLQFTPAGIWVFFDGMPLQFLAAKAPGLGPEARMARVRAKLPVTPPPSLSVDADQIAADSATVDSLDAIVGPQDMPSMFVLLLDNGSAFLIRSEEPQGLTGLLRRKRLELKFAWMWLNSALKEDSPETAVVDLNADGARWLYWITQERMGIIY